MSNSHTVHCQRHFSQHADTIWQIVHDFYSDWHPFIEQCEQEGMQPVRRFTMPGSLQIYREQLTYYSHTQRSFRYVMLEGIAGVEHYRAGVVVEENKDGCLLSWWADIAGDNDLVPKVAKGTAMVFEAGFDEIERRISLPSPESHLTSKANETKGQILRTQQDLTGEHPALKQKKQREVILNNAPPALACTYHPSSNNPDWLCLFLHGIGGNRSNWDEQLSVIAGIMPCAALDLRGYGDSALGAEQTTVEDYCADIRVIARHFGTKKLVLAGLSYGSWIATHFALNYSQELAGLSLCGGCTGMSEAPDAVRQGFLQARLEPMDAGQTPADFADNVVQIISGPEATAEQQTAMRNSMAAIPSATYRDALHCFTHPPGQFDFAQLACPALLVTGEHDKLAPPEEIAGVAIRMVEANRAETMPLPDIQFEIIPNAGHMANLEQPSAYNQALAGFLNRITPC
ncbi:MAG: alpha/beta fold hydrolase [Thiolinea sp.]